MIDFFVVSKPQLFFIRNAKKPIVSSKDLDSSLVSNKNSTFLWRIVANMLF